MPPQKLTSSAIARLQPAPKDAVYWDTDLKGFGLKVTPKGRKVFLVQYRTGGRGSPTKKVTLGTTPPLTPHQARQTAMKLLGRVADGEDPAREKQLLRRKLASDRMSDLVEQFLAQHAAQNRSEPEARRIFASDVTPVIGKRSIHDIKKHDLLSILETVQNRGSPIMANRVLAHMRKFFNWCVGRGIIDHSPCSGIGSPAKERARDRFLTVEELIVLWSATFDAKVGMLGPIVRMLILTGQRREEVTGLRWDELDLDRQQWTIPGARAKNGKAHTVHLSAPAIDLLNEMPRTGDYVFSLTGDNPFQGHSKCKRRLDEVSEVSEWRLHDIRRTIVTHMANHGVPQHVADKILNHQTGVISGVAAVYQKAEFLTERRQALDDWADFVMKSVNVHTSDNVVSPVGS